MNLKELREIIAIFEDANISELDVERQGMKIRLKKGTGGTEVSQFLPELHHHIRNQRKSRLKNILKSNLQW